MAEFGRQDVIAHNEASPARERVLRLFEQRHEQLNITLALPSLDGIKRAVEMDLGRRLAAAPLRDRGNHERPSRRRPRGAGAPAASSPARLPRAGAALARRARVHRGRQEVREGRREGHCAGGLAAAHGLRPLGELPRPGRLSAHCLTARTSAGPSRARGWSRACTTVMPPSCETTKASESGTAWQRR